MDRNKYRTSKRRLNGRTLVLNAIDGEKSIGMASLIWDGGFVALIKDVIVIPEYQKRGIEKELVNKIINFLQNKLKPGYSIQIDVKTFDDIEIFEEIGFQISTKEKRGIPMHLCINFKE